MKYILGLDIGISSIGYSIVRIDKNSNPDKIILLNSIIFPVPKDSRGLSYRKKEVIYDVLEELEEEKNLGNIVLNHSLLKIVY